MRWENTSQRGRNGLGHREARCLAEAVVRVERVHPVQEPRDHAIERAHIQDTARDDTLTTMLNLHVDQQRQEGREGRAVFFEAMQPVASG